MQTIGDLLVLCSSHHQAQPLEVGLVARHFAEDVPAVDDSDAIRERQDLLELGGDEQHRHARLCRGAEARRDVLDRTDVEPLRRLAGDEYRRVSRELACEHEPLLITAGQRPHRYVGRRRHDVELTDELFGLGAHLAPVHEQS